MSGINREEKGLKQENCRYREEERRGRWLMAGLRRTEVCERRSVDSEEMELGSRVGNLCDSDSE